MGTTSEKLTYLNTTKGKIKDSINLTGANITTEPFRQYSTKLEDAYVDIINNGTDTLYNNFPKVSGEGTSLTLNNTYQAPMRNNLKGNTSQTGTPTPTSPIPVNVVSGDNTITITNQGGTDSNTYNIDLPVENLFDKDSATVLSMNTSSTTVNDNMTFTSATYQKHVYIKCQPNTTYTIAKGTSINSVLGVFESTQVPAVGVSGKVLYFSSSNSGTLTITTGLNAQYLDLRITSGDTSANDLQIILDSIQIEKGSKANSYTPYGTTPIELCKIGNYQDYIYKDSDKWYLHKEIRGKDLTSTNVNMFDIYPHETYTSLLISKSSIGIKSGTWASNVLICSHFKEKSSGVSNSIGYFQANANGNNVYFYIPPTATTLELARTYMNSLTNSKIYYVLANPTDEEVTYQPLIDQLNALEKAISYENQTNINQINNDLGFIISASALKKG